MKPSRNTSDEFFAVQDELIDREPLFHRPANGTTHKDLTAMTAEEFWETGASGLRYSRDFVIDMVVNRYSSADIDRWKTEDFYCQEIAPDHYLLTYTLHQEQRVTRRTTLWRRSHDRWLAVYHQGTIVVDV